MKNYIVSVSRPLYYNTKAVEVVQNWDFFSPDLLADYPIDKVEAESRREAYKLYTTKHNIKDIPLLDDIE